MIYQKVKQYCGKNNISIAAFEKRCGIGNGTVSRWENGESNPSLSTLTKMEKATGIPVSDWISVESAEDEPGKG